MNCLDLRRGVLANPRQLDEAARSHVLECAACRQYLEKQRELDADLFEALSVPAPDGLADRILVSRGLRRPSRTWAWALAASVVLAAGIAFLAPYLQEEAALGREAIAHVADEPESFTTVMKTLPDLLPAALADQGIRIAATVGKVTYSQACPMAGRFVRHFVVATADGPVTMFLMPDDPKLRRRAVTEANGMTAVILPAGKGTVMIVAARKEIALGIERALART